ncbi:zinc ribbon domain-containing protein [Terriglobus tenax]|uniref:zinc ribbon domain-containing protein n=1 Tax=Terriglobus tenax TaxID=1111115 RepID=UPI0021DFF542|nr:zinc ribbon domain-containing protein [Terriglobus tenax]
MTCATCGSPTAADGGFCSRCGTRQPMPSGISAAYSLPYLPRVQKHLQTLSILWAIFAAYRVVSVFLGMAFANAVLGRRFFRWSGSGAELPFLHALIPFIFATTLVMAGAAALVAWGLMQRKRWARTLAIVFGVLALLKFPLGTALGVYTLWVLAPAASGLEYDSIAED